VRDGDCVVGLIEAVQKPLPRLIINRFRPLMVKRGDMLDIAEILDVLAIELIGVVPEDESVISAGNKGQPLTWEDRSPAGIAFNHIARRMLGEDVPFQDLFASNGMFNRVSQLFRK
jgi:septum site-determining protein MinD